MIKNKTTQGIRATSRSIINELVGHGKKSLRQLAVLVNRSKSSVHRHRKAQARRHQYPESALWETEAGEAWLKLLLVAVLYSFGLECHVGADKLSRFFKLIRIDTHVGVSPSALRQQLSRMESLLPLFRQRCESGVSAQARSTIVAMDETFFGDFLILVLMDLSSGYLLLEDISQDRRFDTWYEIECFHSNPAGKRIATLAGMGRVDVAALSSQFIRRRGSQWLSVADVSQWAWLD